MREEAIISQVSALASTLDSIVDDFRDWPLEQGPYTHVWLDVLAPKCREGGRIMNVEAVVATGAKVEGKRETLGIDVFSGEDGAAWTAFLRGLAARAEPPVYRHLVATIPGRRSPQRSRQPLDSAARRGNNDLSSSVWRSRATERRSNG